MYGSCYTYNTKYSRAKFFFNNSKSLNSDLVLHWQFASGNSNQGECYSNFGIENTFKY